MSLFIILILLSYFLVCAVSYLFLRKIRYQISYHLGMNVAMTSSGIMGIAVGTLLVYGFPGHYALITIISTIVAILIGVIFGALVDYQTLLIRCIERNNVWPYGTHDWDGCRSTFSCILYNSSLCIICITLLFCTLLSLMEWDSSKLK